MSETRKELADLIDAFNAAWVRPERWAEGEHDEAAVRLRELWATERDRWTVNLLDLIRTWLLYPDDGPDADLEASPDALPSYAQSIARFRDNMALAAEVMERKIIEAMEDDN